MNRVEHPAPQGRRVDRFVQRHHVRATLPEYVHELQKLLSIPREPGQLLNIRQQMPSLLDIHNHPTAFGMVDHRLPAGAREIVNGPDGPTLCPWRNASPVPHEVLDFPFSLVFC